MLNMYQGGAAADRLAVGPAGEFAESERRLTLDTARRDNGGQ
jgi:hypothetical protein